MRIRRVILWTLFLFLGFFGDCIETNATELIERPLAVLYSASDFQNSDGHEQGMLELEKITNKVYESGNEKISEAFICGDYYHDDNHSAKESAKGIESVYKVLNKQWGLEHDEIFFVQGNHDPSDTLGMDSTGGVDREYYSVYQINHNDYMWSNQLGIDIETQMIETSNKLRDWLSNKINMGDSKPIFIITHLPLHHTYRYDNLYAEYLFDVLNEAGDKGLNIIYMFGHNHSSEYDKYLGGSAIYLAKGDQIIIPDIQGENAADYKAKNLNFTYMNAGYIGKTTDGVLSSCIFNIYKDRVEIRRYTKDGLFNLKTSGSASEKDLGWKADSSEIKSPQVVDLNTGIIQWEGIDEREKIRLDIGDTYSLNVRVSNMNSYTVTWESSDLEVVDMIFNKENVSTVELIAKEYGCAEIQAVVKNTQNQKTMKLILEIIVAPQSAAIISYGKNIRFYKKVENLKAELDKPEGLKKDYIITNSENGNYVMAFSSQTDVATSTEKLKVIYVPGIGKVISENTEKNILWRFNEIEGVLDGTKEYQLQISPKSLYRHTYYIAATSGVDSELGYANLTNMRTCSKDVSDGAAIFWIADEQNENNCLVTTHHYKQMIKENGNGKFGFTYDYENEQFVLSNQAEFELVSFYSRTTDAVSDMIIWTEAEAGNAYVGDDMTVKTGGTIQIIHRDEVEEVPITLGMLSGYEKEVSGKYVCTVNFNGEEISDHYELELKSGSDNLFFKIVQLIKDIVFI